MQQPFPLPVETLETLGQVGDLLVAQRRQRAGQQGGQQRGVQPLGQFRGAQLQQRGDQRVVPLLRQAGEQRRADGGAVVARVPVHDAAVPEAVLQDGLGQRLAGLVDQRNPVGHGDPQAGGEVVGVHGGGMRAGLQPRPAAEPAVRCTIRTGAAGEAEFQPHIADPGRAGGAFAHEVPVHRPLGGAERGQPAGAQVGVEEERQQQFERLGLAAAVGPAEQQAALVEGEDLVVVTPDVEDAGSGRHPPRGLRPGGGGEGTGQLDHGHGTGSSAADSAVRGSPTAYRAAAGSGWTRPPVTLTRPKLRNTASASTTSRAGPSSSR